MKRRKLTIAGLFTIVFVLAVLLVIVSLWLSPHATIQ